MEEEKKKHPLGRFYEPTCRIARAVGVVLVISAVTIGDTSTATNLFRVGVGLFVASFVL